MPFDTELLEALIEDSGARWSLTIFTTTLCLMVLQLINAPHRVELAVVAVVAVIGSVTLPLAGRIGAALFGWALLTGFAYNRFGILTFTTSDLTRMALLMVVTASAPLLRAPISNA